MKYKIVRNPSLPSGVEVFIDDELVKDVYIHYILEYGMVPGKVREDTRLRLFRRVGSRYRVMEMQDGDEIEVITKRGG